MKRNIKFPSNLCFRNYQLDFLSTAKRLICDEPDKWHLFSAPTGTGKSICELLLHDDTSNSVLVTPRIEIIRDMLEKSGIECETLNDIVSTGVEYGIHTPIRLRNTLAKGLINYQPGLVILDEAQHDLAETWQDLIMYLNYCPKVGLTATPYRGSPKQTAKFRQQWNNKVHQIISLKDAVKDGFISIPAPTIWPLVDDDVISVSNNEFQSKAANLLIFDRIKDVVSRCKQFWDKYFHLWDRPTMFAVSTSELVVKLVTELNLAGLPAVAVTQASTRKQRQEAFEKVVSCKAALVQIDVVSEGVDLPIRRLIDIKPTLSPVRWLQQVGRVTRPVGLDEELPEYICCCRNLERHGYLMEGMFPNEKIVEAQQAFKQPSKRSGMRAVGLECLGKFTNTPVHCLDGTTAFLYNLISVQGYNRIEYCILLHPNSLEPLIAKKESQRDNESEDVRYKWGKWKLIESIPDVTGFASATASTLTEKQANKYREQASQYGLDPFKPVTNRNFQVLPLLWNLSEQFGRKVSL